ncbi:hypothetical protein HOG21_01165 [bacterium]|nr:hypothetical protein [bacterium]
MTHKTVQFLAFTSSILEIVFSLIIDFGFITITGKFGQIKARGPCFNSQVG